MNKNECYEFDRQGYIIIKNLLRPEEVALLSMAVNNLESHATRHLHQEPRKKGWWGGDYHHNAELGYHTAGAIGNGNSLIIEDFFNADTAFDMLVDHAATMEYIRSIVQGPVRINNSEIRIRFQGNASGTHMGGPINHKYRYSCNADGIDCMMVRMIYFLHPVTEHNGAFCVVPGTHKTNYPSPYGNDPHNEPGMIGLEVEAGDAILFTENLRHGGLINHSDEPRKTIHIGYGPNWMMSQNIATMDELQFVTEATLSRWTEAQRKLFRLM